MSAPPAQVRLSAAGRPARHAGPTRSPAAGSGPAVLVTLLAGVVFSWDVGRPGLWRDEAATMVAVRRSLGDVFRLSGNLDLVHLPYYLLAGAVGSVDGSVTAIRLISVVAMSLAAGLLVGIGRRLGSVRLGVLAGLLLVVNPFASRYAQEARPFAVVALLATAATYLLLHLATGPGRAAQVRYAGALVLLGLSNVLALMLVPAHAGFVWWSTGRGAGFVWWSTGRGAGPGPVRRRWAVATGAGLAAVSPFVLAGFTQRGQVSWIQRPHLFDLRALLTDEFGSRIAPVVVGGAVLAVVAVRVLLARIRGRAASPDPAGAPPRAAVVLGVGWAVLPPVLLFSVSQVLPLWDGHYLVFTLPGLALLLAGAVPGLERPGLAGLAALVVPVLLVGGLGLQAQRAHRDPVNGHGEDLRGVVAHLADRARLGDAVIYAPGELRVLAEVAPTTVGRLDDVALARTPLQAANLIGTAIPAADLPAALRGHDRIWLVEGLFDHPLIPGGLEEESLALLVAQYDRAETRTVTDVRLTLYTTRTG